MSATRRRSRTHRALTPEEIVREVTGLAVARHGVVTQTVAVRPEFVADLAGVPPGVARKALEVAADVVSGIRCRRAHPLTDGRHGRRVTRRADNAEAWRLYVRNNTPQAERLHVWRTAGGVELASLVPHDVYRIAGRDG